MYIGKRGDKKSVMNHSYYTMKIYIGSYPSEIIGREMLEIADEISSILGCTYEKLGYSLLHPDYDYKQIGKSFRNGKKGRTKFINLQIPMLYYGEETDSSPTIEFECHMKNKDIFPYFSIELDYTFHSDYLIAEVNVRRDLLKTELSLKEFEKILMVFENRKYRVNSAFVHCYGGNHRRFLMSGIYNGLNTIEDVRIANHIGNYRNHWKNKMVGVFYMNCVRKEGMPDSVFHAICKIVGKKNAIQENNLVLFKLPQCPMLYRMNRYFPTYSRWIVKHILQKEKICEKDMTWIAAILDLI